MADTKLRKDNVLTLNVLTREQREAELYLTDDEDFVYLLSRKDPDIRVVFSAMGCTTDEIRAAAEEVLRGKEVEIQNHR